MKAVAYTALFLMLFLLNTGFGINAAVTFLLLLSVLDFGYGFVFSAIYGFILLSVGQSGAVIAASAVLGLPKVGELNPSLIWVLCGLTAFLITGDWMCIVTSFPMYFIVRRLADD